MSTLNPLAAKLPGKCPPLGIHRPSFSKPLSPLSLRVVPPPLSHLSQPTVKASSQNHQNPNHPSKSKNFFEFKIDNETSNSMPVKSTLITTIAAAAFFLSGFHFLTKPSVAAPIPPPPTVDSASNESTPAEEKEKLVDEQLYSNSEDIDELKNLVEIKVKSREIPEAIKIIETVTMLNKLAARLETDEIKALLRAHSYADKGNFQLSRKGFNEMLDKNPTSIDACQGLVRVNVDSQEESAEELKQTEKRVEKAIRLSKKNTKNAADLREFKLLRAQIRVLQGKFDDALSFFKELEKEKPDDFRVYLCQAVVYILLNRISEARISFEKCKGLVPEGHPFDTYFNDDSLNAAKAYAQKVGRERN